MCIRANSQALIQSASAHRPDRWMTLSTPSSNRSRPTPMARMLCSLCRMFSLPPACGCRLHVSHPWPTLTRRCWLSTARRRQEIYLYKWTFQVPTRTRSPRTSGSWHRRAAVSCTCDTPLVRSFSPSTSIAASVHTQRAQAPCPCKLWQASDMHSRTCLCSAACLLSAHTTQSSTLSLMACCSTSLVSGSSLQRRARGLNRHCSRSPSSVQAPRTLPSISNLPKSTPLSSSCSPTAKVAPHW
mmetsp:Transcript_24119/g.61653  ORF Transcript_24119/g.61653 Transcript_24119/m.61653 type:complete len:242 (+) Transcript_24119:556-1281(+)